MKKTGLGTLLGILLLLLVVVVSILAGTYARYATTVSTSANAVAANWVFDAGVGSESEEVLNTINLANTIDTSLYPNLKPGTIAPGTSGSFVVTVNAVGSEVGVDYTVLLAAHEGVTLPDGLKFYAQGEENELDGAITGFIPYANVNTPVEEVIEWEWTLGDNAADENYDEGLATGDNNDDAGDAYLLDITIKGEQHIDAANP